MTLPQTSLVLEATLRHVAKSEVDGQHDDGTGGTVFFLSPGVKVSFTPQQGAQDVEIRTERRATSVDLIGCTTPDQLRPR